MVDWVSGVKPLVIGHRGASADALENSLPAFALAQEQGADGIELDVHLSADGVPVVIHDFTLERTTIGHGRVKEHSAKRLQEWGVPALSDVFAQGGSQFLYNVELKLYDWQETGLEPAVARCTREHGLEKQVLISSFSPWAVRRAKQYFSPDTPLAFLHENGLTRVPARWLKIQAIHPYYRLITPRYMAWANKHGYMVNVWTVDDPAIAQQLVNLGVHAIITNHPKRIKSELKEKVRL